MNGTLLYRSKTEKEERYGEKERLSFVLYSGFRLMLFRARQIRLRRGPITVSGFIPPASREAVT